MKFEVKCLYNNGAVMTPKELRCAPSFVGHLLLLIEDDMQQGSSVLMARLVDAAKVDILPPLSDVDLVFGEDEEMLVRGYHYKAEYGVRYKQSWLLHPMVEH